MNRNEQLAKSRLGRLLVNRGYISEQQLSDALKIQVEKSLMLGEVLLNQGCISETDLNRVLKHQKRYRYTATFVALVAAPFQPMLAMAASPASLPLMSEKVEFSISDFGNLGGLKSMDDDELAGVSAQGLVPGLNIGLELGQNVGGLTAGFGYQYRDEEDDEEKKDEQIAKDLADTVLTFAGLGPISNLLDAKITVEGLEYQKGKPQIELLEGGRVKFYMPAKIAKISMEDIRVKGNTSGPTLGSVYMSDISYGEGSSYTIGPKQENRYQRHLK